MIINNILLMALLAICTIDLPAVIVVYGLQLYILPCIVLMCLIRGGGFPLKLFFVTASLSLIIIIITVIQKTYTPYPDLLWSYTARLIYWIMVFTLLVPFIQKTPLIVLIKIIRRWILIYSTFLFIQFIAFYLFHIIVDYSLIIGGQESRILNEVGLRASGLTAEPSIYSGIMISLLILLYLMTGKNNIITYIGLISILCTLSTLGIFLVIVYLAITNLYRVKISKIVFFISLSIAIIFVLWDFILKRIELFLQGGDVSNNIKIMVIDNLFNNESLFLLGYGLVGYSDKAPLYYQALYDLTLFGNLCVIFGVPVGLILSMTIFLLVFNMRICLEKKILIILSFLKITIPNYIFFYFFLVLLYVITNKISVRFSQ
ncbi:hypothetical protein NU104_002022 [Salmonella enterica]|nr:hypothetical protein [Salmonella enterica]ECJ2571682.1 hypothetical protein [Salmonella enterica subsp. arizonae]EDN6649919.1 hypothetical protein [Salmonella enterica]EDR0945756.1 hypothetical protein [Salmonella enterica subsp. arizonae]EEK6039786.1 hypothetical protein [Salmonella enterica]